MKRTRMNRDTPGTRAWLAKRRKPIPARSVAKIADGPRKSAVWAAVLKRDEFRCRVAGMPGAGPCMGRLTPHRLLKGSAGGTYVEHNVVAACEFHQVEIEDRPQWARGLGLVIRRGDVA